MKLKLFLFVFLLLCVLIMVGCKDEIDESDNETGSVVEQMGPSDPDVDSQQNENVVSVTKPARKVGAGNFDKPQLLEVIEVSSANYNLEVPVFEGFEFLKASSDSEFKLSHKELDLVFYFESDFSPNLDGLPSATAKIQNMKDDSFDLKTYANMGGFVGHVQSELDKNFYFTVVYSSDDLPRIEALIRQVVIDMTFSRKIKPSEPTVTKEIVSKKLLAEISSADLSFVENIEIYNKPAYEVMNEGSFKTNVDRYFEENPDEFAEIDFVGSFKVSSRSYLLSWSKNDTTYKYIVSKGCMPHACGHQWGAMITSYNNIFDNYAVIGDNDEYDLYQFNREIPDDLLKILSFVYFKKPSSIEDFKIN
jgi:hypothetical protein